MSYTMTTYFFTDETRKSHFTSEYFEDELRKKKHRDTERFRHNEITAMMRQINEIVPGKLSRGRDTQRAARYVVYLSTIQRVSKEAGGRILNRKALETIYRNSSDYIERMFGDGLEIQEGTVESKSASNSSPSQHITESGVLIEFDADDDTNHPDLNPSWIEDAMNFTDFSDINDLLTFAEANTDVADAKQYRDVPEQCLKIVEFGGGDSLLNDESPKTECSMSSNADLIDYIALNDLEEPASAVKRRITNLSDSSSEEVMFVQMDKVLPLNHNRFDPKNEETHSVINQPLIDYYSDLENARRRLFS